MPIKTRRFPAPLTKAQMKSKKVRYKNDPKYRERAKELSRNVYRRKMKVEFSSCLYSLRFLNKVAVKREVRLPNGRTTVMPVISIPQTADLLQKLYQTLWRWINAGTIPAPVLENLERSAFAIRVFHLEEVRVLIEEIGKHEREMRYLRMDHVEARERIERRILAIRKKLGIK